MRLTNRGKAVVLGGTLLVGALMGKAVDDKVDDYRANSAQPVCEIPARQGDSIDRIERRIKVAGDDVRGEHVEVHAYEDGHVRNPNDDPTFFVNGSMALRAGDTVVIDNVEPNACVAAGGMSPIEQAPGIQANGK